jgi:hypothetical protein
MADIFISYSQTDRERAMQIANALSAKGWKVWWDVSLIAGDRFRAAGMGLFLIASIVELLLSSRLSPNSKGPESPSACGWGWRGPGETGSTLAVLG